MNWLHWPRNVDMVTIEEMNKKPRFNRARTKKKVVVNHLAAEVAKIIQEGLFK